MEDYAITIDFKPDSRNPSRVFRSMAGLIDSFGRLDREFLGSIDIPLDSDLLLHDIEKGSLKAVLRWILKVPDQGALRDGDWKKVVGRLVDDARGFLLERLGEKPNVDTKGELQDIQNGLSILAADVPAGLLHIPRQIPLPRVLMLVQSFESSTRTLTDGDSADYSSEYRLETISTRIVINPALEEELLDTIPVQHPTRVQLPVKKPDLIGDSQWDLYMGNRVIRAKILDVAWLGKFHSREIELKPGDSLDAILEITLLQSPEGEVVGYRYHVLKVINVIPQIHFRQLDLPNNE